MSKQFKPLLAAALEEKDFGKLKFPLYASVKLDGIRVLVIDGVVYSRSLKPIRSKVVQELFGKKELNGLDGEILYGAWNDPEVFNKTTQAVMSTELPEGFDRDLITFVAFDITDKDMDFGARRLAVLVYDSFKQLVALNQHRVESLEELLSFETVALDSGFEGVMLRSPEGKYKQGRSTLKEQILMKLKRFQDDEAIVVGFEEKMHNTNEAKKDNLGHTERSTSKEGLVPAGTLGALQVELFKDRSVSFNIGTGFDDKWRKEIWDNQEKYLGKIVKFKHFVVGSIDRPRFPSFQSFREEDDLVDY